MLINSDLDCRSKVLTSVPFLVVVLQMSPSSVNGRYVRPIHSLVLDTAPLLTSPYGQIKAFNATNYYTVPLAKEEVKDETARAALEIWGQELKVRQPLAKSVQEGMFVLDD
jgi:hypothetical protein